jgi:hypothetical protein
MRADSKNVPYPFNCPLQFNVRRFPKQDQRISEDYRQDKGQTADVQLAQRPLLSSSISISLVDHSD